MDNSTLTKCCNIIYNERGLSSEASEALECLSDAINKLSSFIPEEERIKLSERLASLCDGCFEVKCCHNQCCCLDPYDRGYDEKGCKSIGKEYFDFCNERIWKLEELEIRLTKITKLLKRNELPIHIIFSENFIHYDTFERISAFILSDEYIKTHIAFLSLRGNRLGQDKEEKSFEMVKTLLGKCPNLVIDLSVNYIPLSKELLNEYPGLRYKPF